MPDRLAEKVLLIGWDAADWKVITPMMDAGLMPALQALVERGVMGNIATLDPPFSPMLWTSIATGHTADRHGIVHFTQPNPGGNGIRPVLGSNRKVKALWTILTERGLRSNVVGWWPSHPAEPIDGVMVSNFYQRANVAAHEPWPLAEGTVSPPEFADVLAALRVHPGELTGAHIEPFVPRLEEIDQSQDRRALTIAKILADASSIHAAATFLMEETAWDFTAVYYDAIDHFGHGFMKYHPPHMEGRVSKEDFELYKDVIVAGYRFHDMMLERLLALAGDDTTVILLSDHGFHSDHLRPKGIPNIPAGPAVEHRPFGVFVMAGPGIKRDERVYGAGLLNIAPTVLTLFGLPVGEDMAGGPLLQAFETPPEVETIPTWETGDGPQQQAAADPWAEQEALRQLVELGYVDEPGANPAKAAAASARDSKFNLARVYFSTGRPEEAVPLFEHAYQAESEHREHYGLWLAHAYRAVGRRDEARALAERLRGEQVVMPAALDLLLVDLHLDADEPEAALAVLDAQQAPASVEMQLRRADALLRLQRFDEATQSFEGVLASDPDNARAWNGLAKAHIGRKAYEPAAEAAFAAIGRLYHYPEAHFHLGVAMTRLGWAERAATAFQIALTQRPGYALAHRWLARLYKDYLRQPAEAARHWKAYQEAQQRATPQAPPANGEAVSTPAP
ncbi:MAG: alkaline phosphatase family protein [Rubricoccaceae bacterium]|nr:alkaline phosphatase family protein [Rubricoccaceae bacterium]